MKAFMDRDFLLRTETAKQLYESYADMQKIPVLDYHCHIDPREIFEDRTYDTITQAWLGGDHYKWRQMRANGINENYITGDANDREKFQKWAETLPKLIGNPLYHWSHLELRYYFGYQGNLNADTAQEVWELCNRKLCSPELSVRNLIRRSNVRLICTTDDPIDSLEWHQKLKADQSFDVQVLPAWRPDKAMHIEKPEFTEYMETLSAVSGIEIKDLTSLYEALKIRMDYFERNGCMVSDHALAYVMYQPADEKTADAVLKKRLQGEPVTERESLQFMTAFMIFCAEQYYKRNWAMQLHYGCKRDNNGQMYRLLGSDTGFDCINNYAPSAQLADFLNALSENGGIPKTIIYSLNPNDDAVISSVIGCFQSGEIKNKIQHGSAWWFNDHYTGMTNQMKAFASVSVFSNFVGMLTDSRSFLSYIRHDYFRRILCDLIGGWVENGEYPYEETRLGEIVKGISYNNAVDYFGFDLKKI
ncbi:MAG TPA: glucuronate isomerase [Lachnospiraceae bacterium]|nr:glucuronate isomerase [Lachnospiraceae bacterium]